MRPSYFARRARRPLLHLALPLRVARRDAKSQTAGVRRELGALDEARAVRVAGVKERVRREARRRRRQ